MVSGERQGSSEQNKGRSPKSYEDNFFLSHILCLHDFYHRHPKIKVKSHMQNLGHKRCIKLPILIQIENCHGCPYVLSCHRFHESRLHPTQQCCSFSQVNHPLHTSFYSVEDSVQIYTQNALKMGPETTIVSDGRCEVQSHCATGEKFSRPNQWFQENDKDHQNKIRAGAQKVMKTIFF